MSTLCLWGCKGPERIALKGGTEHLPLLHDRLLQYRERDGSDIHNYTLRLSYIGGRQIRVFQATFKGIDAGQCNFISNGSLVYFETTEPYMRAQVLPEYRQLWVSEGAEVGDGWEDPDFGTSTVFAGYETITVPAGTFSDCFKTATTEAPWFADSLAAWHERDEIKLDEYDKLRTTSKLVVVRWFAKEIGLVKEQIGSSDHVRELVAVTQPGRGQEDRTFIPTPSPTDSITDDKQDSQ